ncbi:hypothetical protein [Mangrovibacterium diazotrophicum]|uniref:Uncharacterized protein n=1 Tax=Mangrovibacterium diazotrophicum TaxID=1261403 RepID=A0A419VU80_9BACT|nr:hypothetical protein [Mangrovibacterium diazotrophicum]RKD85035.1 hypothetical protein BC643_4554 [Mangrovibacterium diazotrophicum]
MKEYKLAKGWAIFIYLLAPILVSLFAWLLILPFQNGDFLLKLGWLLIPVALAMIALMIIGVLDAYNGRLIIGKNRIISISTLSKRELKLEEIKGYTVNEQYIFVEPNSSSKKSIKISKYTGGYREILHWLSLSYPDLDVTNALEEEQEILQDESVGWTKEVREEKLAKARQRAKLLNWVGGLTTAWIFFYPTPYSYSILAAMLIPIVALAVVKLSDGLIRIDEKKGSAYPSLFYALIYPSLGIMLRVLLDFDIFDYSHVWPVSGLITLAFLFLLLINQKEFTFKKKVDYLTVSILALILFAYSFGAVIHINCYYDHSEAEHYTAKILDKRISSGKSRSYYLKLSTWGRQNEIDDVSVSKALYNRAEVGAEVNIYFRNGILDIPWFKVTDK